MTRQVTDNLYIDLGYFTPEDYYVYEANAESALTSTATVVCDFNVISGSTVKEFAGDLSATATLSASATRIFTSQVTLSSSVTVSVEATKIMQFGATWTAVFAPTMTVIAIKNIGATVNVVASLSAVPVVNRATSITLSTIANVNAQAIKVVEVSAQVSGTFTQAAQGNRVNRVVGDPVVYTGGLYGNLEFDATVKKFGTHSIKFLANNNNQKSLTTNIVNTGSKLYGLRSTESTYFNYGYAESTDGNTWSSGSTSISYQAGYPLSSLAYANNRLISWYELNPDIFYSSTNGGTTWTTHTATSGQGDTYVAKIVYSGTHYIRVGKNSSNRGSILRSTDLVSWSGGSYSLGSTSDIGATTRITSFDDVIVSGSTIAAVATVNRIDTGAADSNYLFYSTNHGADWSVVSSIVNLGLLGIGHNGSNLWVVVGRNGDIFTSSTINGTWTKRTSGVTTTLNKVSFSNGLWIIVGDNNVLLTSTNGTTWTQRTVDFSGTTTPFYANSRWWTSNSVNQVYSSTDGITWTSNSTAIAASLPKSAEIAFNDNQDFNSWKTVDFWAYVPTNLASGDNFQVYIEQDSTVYDYSWRVYLQTQPTAIGPGLLYRNTSGTLQSLIVPSANATAYNQWNHYRLSYDAGRFSWYINGTRVATGTGLTNEFYDGTGLRIYTEGPYSDVRIDELLITDAVLTDPTLTSFTVPTTEYVNNDSTDLLLHFNNSYTDDAVTLLRSANSALTSSAAITANLNTTRVYNSALNVSATQTTQAEKVVEGEIDLTANFAQSTTGTRIKQFDSALPVIASQLTAIAKVGQGLIACDVTATLAATAVKTTENELDFFSDFAQTVDNSRLRDFDSTQSAAFTQTTDVSVTTENELDFFADTALTVNEQRLRDYSSSLSSDFAQSTDFARTRDLDSTQSVTVDITAQLGIVKEYTVTLPVVASQLTATAKVGDFLVACDVQSTLACDIEVTSGSIVNLQSTAQLFAQVGKLQNVSASITATTALTAQADVVGTLSATLSAEFAQSTYSTRTRDVNTALTSAFTQSVAIENIKSATAVLSAQAQTTASVSRTRTAVANLPVIASQLTVGSETNALTANLSAQFTLACSVIEVRIDPDLTYMIAKETRTQMIAEELRDDIVIPESRAYTVIKETRDYAISNTEETYII